MKNETSCHIEFPDRMPGEADITAMQIQILVEMGVARENLAPLGMDQASELIRACVVAHVADITLKASDIKRRGVLNPDEPIRGFKKRYELPDRTTEERNITPVQLRILRELSVSGDVCSSLGVDQASVLIRDITIDMMGKRALVTVRRASNVSSGYM